MPGLFMTLFPVPSPTFATLFNPDIFPSPTQLSPAGALGYPFYWRTAPDIPLESILAGYSVCCGFRAVRVGFGRLPCGHRLFGGISEYRQLDSARHSWQNPRSAWYSLHISTFVPRGEVVGK